MPRHMKLLLAIAIGFAIGVLFMRVVPAHAGTIYIDTGGSATNSGSTDTNSATLTGSVATASGSTVILDAATDLSSVITTAGATQSSIYLTSASNTNKKIFWITAVSGSGGATPTVTLDSAATCAANACGAWAIGGRVVLTNASQEGALRAGDTAIFNNSPASQAATAWTFRIAGDSTSGFATIKGKTGVRPALTVSGTNTGVSGNSLNNLWIENLEIIQQGATGAGITLSGNGCVVFNVKISDSGSGHGIASTGNSSVIINSEISVSLGDGINATGLNYLIGNYIHNNTGDGVELTASNANLAIINNIISTNGGRGIYYSGGSTTNTHQFFVEGNTVYANGNSGLEDADADNKVTLINNIFVNNGNAAGEYNVEWVQGTAELISFHGYNDWYHSNCQNSATGGNTGTAASCTQNITPNAQVTASEIDTDPAMNNPGSGNFTITSTSGASATGFPGAILGASGQGFLSMGAQVPTPGATTIIAGGQGIIGGGL